jgi:hypothetical protein
MTIAVPAQTSHPDGIRPLRPPSGSAQPAASIATASMTAACVFGEASTRK